MNLHFRKSSCIAIGAFNVYIIQPEWMAAKGFFDPDSEVSIETKLDEPGFRFSQEGSTVRWVVTPTRIAVETEDEGINCGAVIARILNLLPETPITAVGNNSFFQVFDAPTPPSIPSPECESAYNVTERVFHIGLQTGKTIFNLGLRYRPLETELLINALRPISGEKSSLAASQHANEFLAHRKQGIELVHQHFGDLPCSTHSKH